MKMSASRVPGIFGKMTNTGDKAIDEVQFTVTYSEGKGKTKKEVFSEVHTPIATPLEFTNFGRPVLPFVPGETRQLRFPADGGARDPAEGDARPDGDVDRIHAIGSAAAEASGADAVAGGFARGGGIRGSSRSGGCASH